jgi:gliding motility-associated-like protein
MKFQWIILLVITGCLTLNSQGTYASDYLFIENKGQWPSEARFSTDLKGGKVFLKNNGFRFHFFDLTGISKVHGSASYPVNGEEKSRGHVFDCVFFQSNSNAKVFGKKVSSTQFNYYLASKKENWGMGCRSYEEVYYQGLYNHIDLRYYSNDFSLKYDWVVKPGGDPSNIKWKYDGAESCFLENGRLVTKTSINEVIEQKPIAYQVINGRKVLVACNFVLAKGIFSFEFPNGYDTNAELVIDPELIFSTYSGSAADNFGFTATYDSQGNLYSGSSAFGQGYPTTLGAYQTVWAGGDGQFLSGTDIAISKYSSDGSTMIWSSFIGGPNDELVHSLVCNSDDEVIIYGTTSSPTFPVTNGAFDTTFNGGSIFAPQGVGVEYVNGSDIIISKFSINGAQLIASTFVGGTANDGVNTAAALKFNYADEFRGEIDIDDNGNILIASCTFSSNFPILNGSQSTLGGSLDACVFSMNADLSNLNWSTYYGGAGQESANSIAFNDVGEIYICGGTTSTGLNVPSSAYNAAYLGGLSDGYVARFSSNGNVLLGATFFGSEEYDQIYFVEVNENANVNIYGQTLADDSELIINASWGQPNSGMLVSEFAPDLTSLLWSTVFGTGTGRCNLSPAAFTVDVCGKIYLSGWGGNTNTSTNPNTASTTGLPITSDAFQSTTDGSDFYLLVIESDASDIVYGSFFGGNISQEHVDGGTSRFDKRGVIYQSVCAGCGSNDDFPIFPPGNVVSEVNGSGNCNNGVFKFDFQLPLTIADFQVPPTVCINQPVQVNNLSQFSQTFEWDFGGLFESTLFEPSYTFDTPGVYEIKLIVNNPNTCNFTDTIARFVEVILPQSITIEDVELCGDESFNIGPTNANPSALYEWQPPVYLSDATDPNPLFIPGESTEYTLLIRFGACTDTIRQNVQVTELSLIAQDDIVLCEPGVVNISASANPTPLNYTWSLTPDFINPISSGPAASEVVYNVTTPSVFYVRASLSGCDVIDSVEVDLVSFQTEILGDFTACAGDTINLFVLDPNDDFEYTWSPTSLILEGQNTSSVSVNVQQTTTFSVESVTSFGCTSNDEVEVQVSSLSSLPVNLSASATAVISGQEIVLTATPEGFNYEWQPSSLIVGSGYVVTSRPQSTTTYFVNISDGECTREDSVRVVVVDFVCGPPSIYVPNAFTPNKDGKNEKVFVRGVNLTRIDFKIYNRWGELVFETTNIDRGWDGTFREKEVDPAVFVYYLEAECVGGQTYIEKGNITVIR